MLLIAPCADGTDVGEAWSAYHWVKAIAGFTRVTVISCHKRSRPSLSSQLPELNVVDWKQPALFDRWERLNSMAKPWYPWFYRRARAWIRESLSAGCHYDLMHQITPLAIRYPSPAMGLGTPLIMGPVGGSLSTPSEFLHEMSTDKWYSKLRRFDSLRFRFDSGLRKTYAEADTVIGVAPYVRDVLGAIPLRRFTTMSETGIRGRVPLRVRPEPERGTLRLLYVGRIIRSKGLRDAIRALSRIPHHPGVTLDVVGDGPDRGACEREAMNWDRHERVRFHGHLPRREVDRYFTEADVFLFPSFREPSGNVIMEAMQHSLPCIVADRGGPAQMINDRCGIRVSVKDPTQFAEDLSKAVAFFVENPGSLAMMGQEAYHRVHTLADWSHKKNKLKSVYDSVLSHHQ
ncbi:MAG: glycosyltransferase family 4 protein [Planctomycetota bacterium]